MAASPKSARSDLFRFGPYEANLDKLELRKFGVRVHLERKPWQLLVLLLQRPGELVGRPELQRELWPEGTYVDFELGLNVAMKKVRGALCDSAGEPKYIETVTGHGYRFVAKVERAPATIPASASPPVSMVDSTEVEPPIHVNGARWWRTRKVLSAWAAVICIALLALTWSRPAFHKSRQLDAPAAKKIMLVVLPFDNLSGDSSQEYLSDGMTEELSENLGNQDPRQLGVIGRTSAMTYKYSHRTIREIGKELGVDYVLEGSVRRNGSEVRITAQLVQVSNQAHVWAASYDENMDDILTLERELASEIARQVGVSIAIGQAQRPAQLHDPISEAHKAYLLGRYNWYKRTTEGWKTAEEYFRLAIQRDPNYAAAYAALAECRIPRGEAQAAALKAIALDPTSGEAYTALAWVQLYWFLDPKGAEPAFRRAIELAPNYAQAHYSYSEYLMITGHPAEAINETRQAVLLDPLAPLFRAGLAEVLALTGQRDDAVKQLKAVFEMDPHLAVAHGSMGKIYTQEGRYREAIGEFQTEARLDGHANLEMIGYAYGVWGKRKEALRTLSQLQQSGAGPASQAIVELGLGQKEKALALLEKASEYHDDDTMLDLKVDPIFNPLRSEPRFQNILLRMNFPQ